MKVSGRKKILIQIVVYYVQISGSNTTPPTSKTPHPYSNHTRATSIVAVVVVAAAAAAADVVKVD